MSGLIYLIIIIAIIKSLAKKYGRSASGSKDRADLMRRMTTAKKKTASAEPNKRRPSAVPNVPKRQKKTREEAEMAVRTRTSARACKYEAAYSKGKPDRIGVRADYDPATPSGRCRVRCSYCGAENFVPAGTSEHYHCYFCWEKL